MKGKLIRGLFVVFAVLCLCVTVLLTGVEASEYAQEAEIFMLHAHIAYQDGRTQDAIRDYHKILMLDPENREARNMLDKIVNEGGLYTRARQATYQIEDLGKHIKIYKEMASVLEQEKERIDQKFNALLTQKQSLAQKVVSRDAELAALHGKVETLYQRVDLSQRVDLPEWPVTGKNSWLRCLRDFAKQPGAPFEFLERIRPINHL